LLREYPCQLRFYRLRIIHPVNTNPRILHHVPRAVVPRAQIGAQFWQRLAQVLGNALGERGKRTRPRFQMERGQFRADGENLRVDAGVEL
jgi:hypothetical protein